MYDQKDIVLIPFPFSDLTGAKQRPALILSNNKLNRKKDRICCLITSKPALDGIVFKMNSFSSGQLPFKSWVKPQRIFTINEKMIKKKICEVNDKFHSNVISRLNEFLQN